MPKNIIEVENLSKYYRLGEYYSGSLRQTITNLINGKYHSTPNLYYALNQINFVVQEGDVLGLLGRNGAGKSTLLKVLSRITFPSQGKVKLYGRVASLLEVGTGFHPELTGRENIFLNGSILGMSQTEIKSKFDEIVTFSGVEKFLDTAIKHYSSGMYVRLAFSVAAHLEPEVLIIDEVLAVGDAEFQKKCLRKMKDVAKSGRTAIFVSHNMSSIASLCNKCLWLEKGKLKDIGAPEDLIQNYLNPVDTDYKSFKEWDLNFVMHHNIEVLKPISIALINTKKQVIHYLKQNEAFGIQFNLEIKQYIKNITPVFIFKTLHGESIFTVVYPNHLPKLEQGINSIFVFFNGSLLNEGSFSVQVQLCSFSAPTELFFNDEEALFFEVIEDYELRDFDSREILTGAIRIVPYWELKTKSL